MRGHNTVTAVLLLAGGIAVHAQAPQVSTPPQETSPKQPLCWALAEDQAFWPIYREYDVEMSKLGDERIAVIAEYARNYSNLTDNVADGLAHKALDLEARRQAVKAKYYDRIAKALSPRTALRFLQVEQQLLLLIDLQITSSLPIAK